MFLFELKENGLMDKFFYRIQDDPRIGASHIALFAAMAQISKDNQSVQFYGRELRQLAKVYSSRTYFKILRDLQECCYISYKKGRCRWERSLIVFTV